MVAPISAWMPFCQITPGFSQLSIWDAHFTYLELNLRTFREIIPDSWFWLEKTSTSRQHPQNANKKTQLLQRHSLVCKKNTHQVELLNHSVIKLLLYHLTVMQMNNNYLLNGQLKFIWIYGIVSNRHVIPIRTWCYCSFNLFRIFAGWSVNDSITWAVRERYSS